MVFRQPPGIVAVMQMGVTAPTEPLVDDALRPHRRGVAAVWSAPLWIHAALVLVILLAILPFTKSGPVWLADEGGMRLQAELLADDQGWSLQRPFADLDPEEITTPIESASINGEEYTPFAKHVAASILLGASRRLAGPIGLILLSILATAIAAWVVGAIAEGRRRGTGRWALWALGLGCPLVIYSYTSTSHTIGVAIAAVAVASAVAVLGGRLAWAVPLLLAVAVGPQFRNEALLFGGAVAIVLLAFSLRPFQIARFAVALGVGAAAVAGFAANLLLEQSVAGALSVPVDTTAPGAVERIVNAGTSVLVRVSTDDAVAAVAVFALAGATVLLLGWLHHEPQATKRHLFHAGLVIASAAALLLVGPAHIYGLLLAFPLLLGGLLAIRSDVWSVETYRFLLIIGGVYVVAVLLTHDFGGGGVQWGGRYLFLALPALLPPAIAGIAAAVGRLDREPARVVIAAVVIGAGVLTITSIQLLSERHEGTGGVVTAMSAAAVAVGPAGDGGGPVIFSQFTNVGRMSWETVEDIRYLLMPEDAIAEYTERFAAEPIDRFVLLASNDEEIDRFIDEGFAVSAELGLVGPARLVAMERSP
jgi:hypothetical protein